MEMPGLTAGHFRLTINTSPPTPGVFPMKLIRLAVLAATAATFAAPTFAQQGGGRAPQTPEQMEAAFVGADANKDGKLDKAELKMTLPEEFRAQVDDARLATMMERRDTDKDGFVSKAEYTAPRGPGGPGGGGRPPGR
jgi:hypothetical protein